MKNWFGKHRQTLCTLLICAMGCGLLMILLYPYKCREEGCYNLAFDDLYCEQHWAETVSYTHLDDEAGLLDGCGEGDPQWSDLAGAA